MCLYPTLMKNKKYIKNNKNGGIIPPVNDPRVLWVPVACGNCMECRKAKKREWQIRLTEDIKHNTNGKFITLTFSDESIKKIIYENEELQNLSGYPLDNAIATRAVRLFSERWRKQYKKAPRHWLVTELGHENTENIHLHGILWTNIDYGKIASIWQYGYIWPKPREYNKTYVNPKTVNYTIKYVHKQDIDHPNYKSKILCSKGIGSDYTKTLNFENHKYKGENTNEGYKLPNGSTSSMPIYYRNKAFTDDEREKLWLHKLDKNEIWICGEKVAADDAKTEYELRQWYRRINKELGYGTNEKDYDQLNYENERRNLLNAKRVERATKKNQINDYTKIPGHENTEYHEGWKPISIQF